MGTGHGTVWRTRARFGLLAWVLVATTGCGQKPAGPTPEELLALAGPNPLGALLDAYPTAPHPRLPGPLRDGYLTQLNPKRRAELAGYLRDWKPVGGKTRARDLQAAVILARADGGGLGLQKLDQWIQSFDLSARKWPPGWSEGLAGIALAWIYDQTQDLLSADQKSLWFDRALGALVRLRQVWIQARYSVFNSITYNRTGAAILWLSLALYPEAEARIGREAWDWNAAITNDLVRAWRVMLKGGGWPEGWTYWGQGGRMIYQAFAGLDATYGTNLLREEAYVQATLRMRDYLIEPDGSAVPFGDQHTHDITIGPDAWNSFEAYREVAFATADPHALKALGRRDPTELPLFPWGHRAPRELSKEAPPPLPLSHDFEGAGVFALRDAFAGEDSCQITITCGGDKVSHQNASDGHFWIWHRGLLAGDAGCYALGSTSEHCWLYRDSAGWNTLRIYDPKDPSPNERLSVAVGRAGKSFLREEIPVPRDGGQKRVGSGWTSVPRSFAEWKAREAEFRAGRVTRTHHEKEFSEIRCDLTQAYRSYPNAAPHSGRTDRVHDYERTFIYLRPRLLIVIDRLKLTDPSFALEFVTHTRESPERLSDQSFRLMRKSAVEGVYGIKKGLRYRRPDGRYQFAGEAVITSLLTDGLTAEARTDWATIEGKSYRRQQNPAYRNKPDWSPVDPTKVPIETCGQRVEFRYAPNGNNEHTLVHTIAIGAAITATATFDEDGALRITLPDAQREFLLRGKEPAVLRPIPQ